MPILHVVQQGECLSAIARKYGLPDFAAIYDHPDNADFKKKRKDPNVIHPGDRVVIPDRAHKTVECATGATHVFKAKLPKRKLELRMQDASGDPIAGVPYVLLVGEKKMEGTTSSDGLIRHDIPWDARSATLEMNGVERTLRIGDLNPMADTDDKGITGVQSRLANLGYSPGRVDGVHGKRTTAAIKSFQSDHGMTIDGLVTGALISKLREVHGS